MTDPAEIPDGSTILITGASSGFGHDLARETATRGHTVFATMRGVQGKNADVAEELLEWATRERVHLHVMELDVTKGETVVAATARAVEETGRIDAVVNNAGVGAFGPAETFTPDQVAGILDVNLVGAHRVTRAALPGLRKSDRGVVVYMSSALGRMVFPFVAPYAAAKFAVEGLAETWAYELRPQGIDTVIVEPGGFDTSFGENMWSGADEERMEEIPELMERFEGFAEAFMGRAEAGELGDPRVVVEAVADVIDAPSGERPLRLPLGEDVSEMLNRLNARSREIQEMAEEQLGFGGEG